MIKPGAEEHLAENAENTDFVDAAQATQEWLAQHAINSYRLDGTDGRAPDNDLEDARHELNKGKEPCTRGDLDRIDTVLGYHDASRRGRYDELGLLALDADTAGFTLLVIADLFRIQRFYQSREQVVYTPITSDMDYLKPEYEVVADAQHDYDRRTLDWVHPNGLIVEEALPVMLADQSECDTDMETIIHDGKILIGQTLKAIENLADSSVDFDKETSPSVDLVVEQKVNWLNFYSKIINNIAYKRGISLGEVPLLEPVPSHILLKTGWQGLTNLQKFLNDKAA